MNEKINQALEYVAKRREAEARGELVDMEEARNDAANIFADTYDEYLEIWKALEERR